jgi:SagB-type dehydrogenase family enzyme
LTTDRSAPGFTLDRAALIGVDEDGNLTGWLAHRNAKFSLTARQLVVLAHVLADGVTGDRAAESKEQAAILSELVTMGFLKHCPGEHAQSMPGYWSSPEALVHLRASLGWPRSAPPAGIASEPKPEAASSVGETIQLASSQRRARRMASVLRRRRSSRMLCDPLALEDLAMLLHLSCDSLEDPVEQGRVHRPYPTAGGSDELSVLLIPTAVLDLRHGVYSYDPERSALVPLPDPPATELARHNIDRARTYLGLADELTPAALLVINASWPRIIRRYSEVGMISAYCDAGALLQTMYLVAADLGLPCTAVSSLSSVRNAEILGADPLLESQVACFAVGGSVKNQRRMGR